MIATNDNSNPQQGYPFIHHKNKQHQQQHCREFNVPLGRKDARKLFVGGLPAKITEEEFHEFFAAFGVLVDSVVMFDRETRRSRGFGFVTFEDPMVCLKLLMMGNEGVDSNMLDVMQLIGRVDMEGKTCEIKAATPKANSGTRNGCRGDSFNKRMMHQQQPTYGAAAPILAFVGEHVGALGPGNTAMLDNMMYHGYGSAASPAAMYYPPHLYMALPSAYLPHPYYIMEVPPPVVADAPISAINNLAPDAVVSPQFSPHSPAMIASPPHMFPPVLGAAVPFGMPPVAFGGGTIPAGDMMPMDDTTVGGLSEQRTAL